MQATAVEKPTDTNDDVGGRCAVAFCFTLDDDLRFLSHRDELRMLTRVLRRAGWPLAYSGGFNPRPRIVLPLPRRVGSASECEWAVVQLSDAPPLEQLRESLAAALPPTCPLHGLVTLAPRAKPHPRRVTFAVELEPEHAAQATLRLPGVRSAKTLIIERASGPYQRPGTVDIRPYLETITLAGRTLSMRLTFVNGRTARPTEVMTVLTLPAPAYNHRVRQVQVEWDMVLAGPNCWPPGTERNNLAQEENRYTQAKNHKAKEESQIG